MSYSQRLPPKMAQYYANLAKEGKYTSTTGSTYQFLTKTEEIVLVCLEPPDGYVKRRKGKK